MKELGLLYFYSEYLGVGCFFVALLLWSFYSFVHKGIVYLENDMGERVHIRHYCYPAGGFTTKKNKDGVYNYLGHMFFIISFLFVNVAIFFKQTVLIGPNIITQLTVQGKISIYFVSFCIILSFFGIIYGLCNRLFIRKFTNWQNNLFTFFIVLLLMSGVIRLLIYFT